MKSNFYNQEDMIRRPIPSLSDTCNRFLTWVKPLLSEDEFQKTKAVTDAFADETGDGARLQKKLLQWHEKEALLNWSEPLWYDIYLDARKPLPINSNVFYLLEENEVLNDVSQTATATALVLAILAFKSMIDQETLPVDMQNGSSLCMHQYTNLFQTTRIPQSGKDLFFKALESNHIIVMNKDNLFKVDVLNLDGSIKTYNEIEQALIKILDSEACPQDEKIGFLTTLDRETWASLRKALTHIGETNISALNTIDSAIFVLCLDEAAPDTPELYSEHFLHANGTNRWFDKALQFIVTKNNRFGLNLEHTGFDGSVVTNMVKYIHNNITNNLIASSNLNALVMLPVKIEFDFTDQIRNTLKLRTESMEKFAKEFTIRVVKFEHFGKNLIKTFNISPDAFVQIAFQLAQYKLFGRCYSSYEAVMVRNFYHGRIEVSHCITMDSLAFIKSMLKGTDDNKTKEQLLIKAAESQNARLTECREGRGIDSHLYALLKMSKMESQADGVDKTPEFFNDTGYQSLVHSTICTSTTSAHGVDLVGYGPVVDDGFAIRYLKNADTFTFNMVSRKAIIDQLDHLADLIIESLMDMAELMKNKTV